MCGKGIKKKLCFACFFTITYLSSFVGIILPHSVYTAIRNNTREWICEKGCLAISNKCGILYEFIRNIKFFI